MCHCNWCVRHSMMWGRSLNVILLSYRLHPNTSWYFLPAPLGGSFSCLYIAAMWCPSGNDLLKCILSVSIQGYTYIAYVDTIKPVVLRTSLYCQWKFMQSLYAKCEFLWRKSEKSSFLCRLANFQFSAEDFLWSWVPFASNNLDLWKLNGKY